MCESKDFIDANDFSLHDTKLNGKVLKFITFYRSPKCGSNRFLNFLENMLCCYGRNQCIFAGDSNIEILDIEQSEELMTLLVNYDVLIVTI